MKRPFIILLLLLPLITTGQIPNMTRQKTVDSLFVLLKKENGSRKVDLLNQLALNLAPRNYDSSFRFATEALRLSKKLNYPRGKGIATLQYREQLLLQGRYKECPDELSFRPADT